MAETAHAPRSTAASRKRRWWLLPLALIGLLIVAVLLLGLWPVAPDTPQIAGESRPGPQANAPQPPASVGTPRTLVVSEGDTIQAALDQAAPGDTVLVEPGTYNETLEVNMYDITLKGQVDGERRPMLDGQNNADNGVLAIGGTFTMEGFDIRNYRKNGVIVRGADGVTLRDIRAEHTGEYALFPVESANVLIENCITSGVIDAAIYVGQSRDIVVRNNESFDNTAGIEIENSIRSVIEDNYVHNNSGGILTFLLPDHVSKENHSHVIRNNRIINNNKPNTAPKEMIVSTIPPGTGVMLLAADDTEVTGNEIRDNRSFGVAVVNLTQALPSDTLFDVGIYSERNRVYGNTFSGNGDDPAPVVTEAGLSGADLLWDATGMGNTWDQPGVSRYPPLLPSSDWPSVLSRAYSRALSWIAGL